MSSLKIFHNGKMIKTIGLHPRSEYVFGRGDDCTLNLTDGTGISRHHFRLIFNGSAWQIDVLSKFRGLISHGAEVDTLELRDGQSFYLQSYEFIFSEDIESIAPDQTLNMERTVAETFKEIPYLRISLPDGQRETFRLEGNFWVAGRDDSCEIVIRDHGASRRHFELSLAAGQAYVVDLNSANGTMINGQKIAPEQATPLRSGDVISVLSFSIVFELRDPNFEKQLTLIPGPVLEPVSGHPVSHAGMALIPAPASLAASGNHRKIFAGATVVLALLIFVSLSQKNANGPSTPANVHKAFANLPPKKKAYIRDTYKLAKNLYLQRNYPLALKEIQRIHEIVPFYEDTRQMAAECQQHWDVIEQKEELERRAAAVEELKRRIAAKVFECESKMTDKTTMASLNRCLEHAIELSPDNEGIRRLQAIIEERELRARQQAVLREDFRRRTITGNDLYEKARRLELSGKDYHAVLAYKKYLNSGLPDTNGYRGKANRSMASLERNLKFKVDSMIKRAQSYFEQADYREAMNTLKAAETLHPNSPLIDEIKEKFRKQINRQMKIIYEDSIVEESLGNVEAAKDKWRKILEMSYPDDSYYQKAKDKLKKYVG